MSDPKLMDAKDVVSPKAVADAEAAEAEASKAFGTVGKWASEFIHEPVPPLPGLLARQAEGRDGVRQEPWMPAGRLGIVASPGGKGKTAVLMHLAGHVAAGGMWCGLHVVKPGPVVLILGEEDLGECHRRLKAAWKTMNTEDSKRAAARTLVLPLAGTGDNRLVKEDKQAGPQKSDRAEDLVAYLKRKGDELGGWSLVVVDPFARFAGMDAEKDNASATSTITVLEELLKLNQPGTAPPTVLFSHHCRKGKKEDEGTDPVEMIRGSSAIKDGARWVAMLERQATDSAGNGQAVLRVVKTNRTSWDYALELKTLKGVVTGGEPKLVADIRAERAGENGNGKDRKSDKTALRAKAEGAGAVANHRRFGPEGT